MTLRDDPEPEDERSPVEEAGREEEGAEDEELGSSVEEGEEAALALDLRLTELKLQWLSIAQNSVRHSEVSCQDRESNDALEHEEASASIPKSQATEGQSNTEWDIHCPSAPGMI